MTRRELREHCFKLLFCADFYPTDEMQEQVDVYFTEPKEEDDVPSGIGDIIHNPMLDTFDGGYVKSKVEKILDVLPELDKAIDGVAQGWTTRRMGKVELTILRLALYEIKHDDDVPEKVAINEAVELAKKYDTEKSAGFVNGILNSVAKEFEENGAFGSSADCTEESEQVAGGAADASDGDTADADSADRSAADNG